MSTGPPGPTTDTPPALIVGGGVTALGLLRCFGRAGIPSVCITKPLEVERHSRYFHKSSTQVDVWSTARELAAYLRTCPYDRAFLAPSSDHWAVELSRLPAEITERFPTGLPSPDVMNGLIDKANLVDALVAAGIPHPVTEPLDDPEQLKTLLGRSSDSQVFLKPADSQRFMAAFHEKAWMVSDVGEALRCFERAREAGMEMVLQEYIPGPPDRHYFIEGFVDSNHRIAASFVRRRIRMHPPSFGNSSYMVSLHRRSVAPALESLQTLFERSGYRGIFMAEFKYDYRDELFKLIEVNCRPWWYIEFAATCGANMAEIAYKSAFGLPFAPPAEYRIGQRLVYSYYDYQACRRLRAENKLSAGDWLRSWATARRAIFAFDDPAPAVWTFAHRVRNWVAVRVGRRPRRTRARR